MRTETEKKAMKITLKENSTYLKTDCFICGGRFERGEIAIIVHHNNPFTYSNDVCETCFRDGPKGVRTRARAHAETLKGYAAYLEEVTNGPIEAPSYRKYKNLTAGMVRLLQILRDDTVPE